MSATSPPVKHAPDYANRGPSIVAFAIVLLIVPTITVTTRLWSRAVASRARFWWDDFMLLSTLLFSHLYLATVIWGVTLGVGKHSWMIPIKYLKATLMMQHLQVTFYVTSTQLMRLSALTLYARIFRVRGIAKNGLWILGTLITGFWVASLVVPWTACTPLRRNIDPYLKGGKCVSRTHWYIAAGTINVLFDLAILLFPMPLVWKLQLKTKRKILVSIVLMFGYASAVTSLTRLIMILRNQQFSVLLLELIHRVRSTYLLWDTVPILYVSSLEAPFGIVALCGPPINQMVRRAKNFGWRSLLNTKDYSDNVPTPVRSFKKHGEKAKSPTTTIQRQDSTEAVEMQAFRRFGNGLS